MKPPEPINGEPLVFGHDPKTRKQENNERYERQKLS
jgi:hypothetical protein